MPKAAAESADWMAISDSCSAVGSGLIAFQDEVAGSDGFLKQPPGKDYAFAGESVKDDKFFGVGTGMGLRKTDTELKAALDKAFAEMRKDGTYDKYAKKYFDFDVYGG